ncbi:MAG TPA: CHAT domain-containing protein [Pyrinomonadaceae bacterium]|jgi:hypothetical protein
MLFADLEISLHRWDEDTYAVEMRFRDPESESEPDPERDFVEFDFAKLEELAHEGKIAEYGQTLTDSLFKPSAPGKAPRKAPLRELFVRACTTTLGRDNGILRLRLFIAPSAPELNGLRWETFRDPVSSEWLLSNQNILFFRYLSSQDFRPVRLRRREELRTLAVIADPTDLGKGEGSKYLPQFEINLAAEVERLVKNFGGSPLTLVGRAAEQLGPLPETVRVAGGGATFKNLLARLRDDPEEYDILYLVCHGMFVRGGGPRVWLEAPDGTSDIVAGNELASALGDLRKRPRLVVLVSCQSAGRGGGEAAASDKGSLAALGPRLARVGIPAVVAMQSNVTVRTISEFMPVFLGELQKDGFIDRAVAVARGAVSREEDSWAPVLFCRISTGRIWYDRGFAEKSGRPEAFPKWPALLASIEEGMCTPIIGSGLLRPLIGSTRDIARRWAITHHYPITPYQDDLPQVSQYLTTMQPGPFMRRLLRNELGQEVIRRFGDALRKKEDDVELPDLPLEELMCRAGTILRGRSRIEPHSVLASLPLPVYITTNPDGLMLDALSAAKANPRAAEKKQPVVDYYRWDETVGWPPSIKNSKPDYEPTVKEPLLYYLFGSFQVQNSVVLSEDNYFDYLYGITRKEDPMPGIVRAKLANSALLFLGFQLDDWDFRVLFRSIMGQEGRNKRKTFVHVAVQINPEEESRIRDPEKARQYLEERFEGADISIYWGSVADFMDELRSRWNEWRPYLRID